MRSLAVIAVIALGALGAFAACGGPAGTTITNVIIVDGTGLPAVTGSVRFVGDTIVAVGHADPVRGDTVIDGHGMVLAPGFIDTHSHHGGGLLTSPEALSMVSQGITTIVGGNDGSHPYPLAAAMDSLRAAGPSVNVAYYAGHGTIRSAVMGDDFARKATPREVDSMAVLLQHELDAGALGLSSGLEYDPGIYSDRAEVLALAKVAAAAGSRYASHIRSEDRWFWDAIDEIITIGREAKLPVQVSHIKLGMIPLWGRADSLVALLDAARASGVDITADIYPYTYWSSTLTVLFPRRDFANRAEANTVLREIARPEGLLIGHFEANPAYAGRTVAEISRLRKEDPASTLMGLIRESLDWEKAHPGRSGESVVATGMDEPDIVRLLQWNQSNICSDGSEDGAHPRGFGAFPRVLARYVRAERALTLEDAIHKMTALSAAHVGITKRGTIAPGRYADLVLLDPAAVADRATPAEPHLASTGIVRVWVNGQTVWEDGATRRVRAGRMLTRENR
ncbi:MAG: amidohydrolase family protein [Gemmatimonadota bacterium]|nr:amidohydrolase family protein [Gemmatimonadota bacterium]